MYVHASFRITRRSRAQVESYQSITYVLADTSLAEEFEELELAEGTKAEHRVVERHDLLDGDLAPRWPVHGRADNTIRALADDIQDLVLCTCARQ